MLVIRHFSLEEVFLFLHVDLFGQPWEGVAVFFVAEGHAQAFHAAVGDVLHVIDEHIGVEAKDGPCRLMACGTTYICNNDGKTIERVICGPETVDV